MKEVIVCMYGFVDLTEQTLAKTECMIIQHRIGSHHFVNRTLLIDSKLFTFTFSTIYTLKTMYFRQN